MPSIGDVSSRLAATHHAKNVSIADHDLLAPTDALVARSCSRLAISALVIEEDVATKMAEILIPAVLARLQGRCVKLHGLVDRQGLLRFKPLALFADGFPLGCRVLAVDLPAPDGLGFFSCLGDRDCWKLTERKRRFEVDPSGV